MAYFGSFPPLCISERRFHQTKGSNLNGDVIVHGATDVLAHAASYTTFNCHHKALGKIHGQRIRGTFRDTGMAPLPRGAEPMVDDSHSHADVLHAPATGSKASVAQAAMQDIITEIARHLVGKITGVPS